MERTGDGRKQEKGVKSRRETREMRGRCKDGWEKRCGERGLKE